MEDVQTMTNMNPTEAFNLFRQGRIDELAFIPNIEELRQNFLKEGRGLCCASRRALIHKYNALLAQALRDATQ